MPKIKDYNVREATEEDAIDLTILGKQFVKESQNEFLGWDAAKVHDSLFDAIQREDFGVFVLCAGIEIIGMFICFATPCFFSNAVQAVEIVWYVDPNHRGSRKAFEMLDLYEEWAESRGAVCVNLVNLNVLNSTKVAKLYKRRGYTLSENTFMKEL